VENFIKGKLRWLNEALPTSHVLANIRKAAHAARYSVAGPETGIEFATKMATQNLNNVRLRALRRLEDENRVT
jgi:hypothetical protein